MSISEEKLIELEESSFLDTYSENTDSEIDWDIKSLRIKGLYSKVDTLDDLLDESLSMMHTKDLLTYRKDLTTEIASLEGRNKEGDMSKFIPMNVTFIQNNIENNIENNNG